MYGILKNGTTQFIARPAKGARKVEMAGSHTNWAPVAMKKQADGSYVAKVALAPGTYEYKFIIDGSWCTDPDNQKAVKNPYGTANSLATVPDKSVSA